MGNSTGTQNAVVDADTRVRGPNQTQSLSDPWVLLQQRVHFSQSFPVSNRILRDAVSMNRDVGVDQGGFEAQMLFKGLESRVQQLFFRDLVGVPKDPLELMAAHHGREPESAIGRLALEGIRVKNDAQDFRLLGHGDEVAKAFDGELGGRRIKGHVDDCDCDRGDL